MRQSGRFEFGKNWQAFLETVDDQRVEEAAKSLQSKLEVDSLKGKHFLDLGCGSGLFSLAAYRLGAEVTSIDYDVDCVGCTTDLREKHADSDNDPRWSIVQGSALDPGFMERQGEFDVVYSWGVLHHTGDMKNAIRLASERVAVGGQLVIAIYNDQGGASRRWHLIKRIYNWLPTFLRSGWVGLIAMAYETKFAAARLARLRNPSPLKDWQAKKRDRGMSVWHDWVDWVGGLPFEVATPEQIIMPLRERGFLLDKLKTVGNGWGCNEYVFQRSGSTHQTIRS